MNRDTKILAVASLAAIAGALLLPMLAKAAPPGEERTSAKIGTPIFSAV